MDVVPPGTPYLETRVFSCIHLRASARGVCRNPRAGQLPEPATPEDGPATPTGQTRNPETTEAEAEPCGLSTCAPIHIAARSAPLLDSQADRRLGAHGSRTCTRHTTEARYTLPAPHRRGQWTPRF